MNSTILLLTSTLGWVGAIGTVVAYALVTCRRLEATSFHFQLVNACGAALLGLSALTHGAWSSAASNGIWMVIGLQAIAVMARRPRATVIPLRPDPTPAPAAASEPATSYAA